MSKYTTTIYELQRNGFNIGLSDYEIFDEEYRPLLNKAIIDFYLFREIAYDNVAYWKEKLNAKMDMIMRNKYNMLYEIKKTDFNPLYNIDITETFTSATNATGNSNNSTNNLNVSSQYPNEEMLSTDLSDTVYADSATKGKETNETQTSDNTNTNYTRTEKGSSAGLPFSKALIQFQEFANEYRLDEQVIYELGDLFLNVW